jgi:hypothetical protein
MSRTRIMELLNIDAFDNITIIDDAGNHFAATVREDGEIMKRDKSGDPSKSKSIGQGGLVALLNGSWKIIRRPTLTDEQREVLELLRNIGLNKVARDEDGSITAFEKCPVKGRDYWLSGAEGGYCETQRLSCLRPLIPDWTVPLYIPYVLGEEREA